MEVRVSMTIRPLAICYCASQGIKFKVVLFNQSWPKKIIFLVPVGVLHIVDSSPLAFTQVDILGIPIKASCLGILQIK